MNAEEIRTRFPRCSAAFIRANLSADSAGPATVVEHSVSPLPLAADKAQETCPERLLIRFVSVRKRLLDPDNIAEKWMLDALRFIGAIRGDEPERLVLETTQRKAAENEIEHTEIVVVKL